MNTNLKHIRKLRKITLKNLSSLSGIRYETIQRLDNGSIFINQIDKQMLREIASVLHVKEDTLLEWQDISYKDISRKVLSYCRWYLEFSLELSCEGPQVAYRCNDIDSVWELFLVMCGDELSKIQKNKPVNF